MQVSELDFKEPTSGYWAEVILPLALPTVYTYAVPPSLLTKTLQGCRAEVQLKNKKYAGLVKRITDKEPVYKTKNILNILDDAPLLYPQQMQLWQWMSEYYMCSEGEVMAAALPANFKLSSEAVLIFNEAYGDDFTELGDEEYLIAEALLLKTELSIVEVQQVIDNAHVYPVIKKLIEKNVCYIREDLSEKYKIKKEKCLRLC
jgi:primosomal protein N' (replication factor Y) (superfamily II helicase)